MMSVMFFILVLGQFISIQYLPRSNISMLSRTTFSGICLIPLWVHIFSNLPRRMATTSSSLSSISVLRTMTTSEICVTRNGHITTWSRKNQDDLMHCIDRFFFCYITSKLIDTTQNNFSLNNVSLTTWPSYHKADLFGLCLTRWSWHHHHDCLTLNISNFIPCPGESPKFFWSPNLPVWFF